MTKVIRGDLSGERQKGYESYKTNYGVGPSVTVRRGIPTTEIAAVGTSLAQRQQKNAFYVATSVYSKFNNLEKDFYKRWWIIDTTIDPQYTLEKRILTGRHLAMSIIGRSIAAQVETYQKPLPFCICAVDIWGDPAPGHELNIECEKLGNYTYKEKNNIYACFTPSSLSSKYDPYHLFFTDHADYCLLTAEEIHKIKYLSIDKNINFRYVPPFDYKDVYSWGWFVVTYFGERGLPLEYYDMRLKIRWKSISGQAGARIEFGALYHEGTSAPMPLGGAGEATLWARSKDRRGVWIRMWPGWPEDTHFKGVELSVDIVNLPC